MARLAVMCGLVALTLAACGGGDDHFQTPASSSPPATPRQAASVQPVASMTVLRPGWEASVELSIKDDLGRNVYAPAPVAWSISDESIASFTAGSDGRNGRLKGLAPGKVSLSATFQGVTGSLEFDVRTDAAHVLAGITAGAAHTCARSMAGPSLCWGSNTSGQLGNGTYASSAVPVEVSLPSRLLTRLAAGSAFTCGSSAEGYVFCWGDNTYGQLGDGTNTGRAAPVGLGIALYSDVAILAAGGRHACVSTDDVLRPNLCWGANDHGQLGDGTVSQSSSPVVIGRGKFFQGVLSAGADHTCAMDAAAYREPYAFCWGRNSSGQLGTGYLDARTVPTPVLLRGWLKSISSGGAHTCGISSQGEVYCWGDNTHGQLGNGTNTGDAEPVLVTVPPLARIAAGRAHTCGLAESGKAWCWGANSRGQLGNGGQAESNVAVAVAAELEFDSIVAGDAHTCALTKAGAAYCWGANDEGQLGDGTVTDRSAPVRAVDQ